MAGSLPTSTPRIESVEPLPDFKNLLDELQKSPPAIKLPTDSFIRAATELSNLGVFTTQRNPPNNDYYEFKGKDIVVKAYPGADDNKEIKQIRVVVPENQSRKISSVLINLDANEIQYRVPEEPNIRASTIPPRFSVQINKDANGPGMFLKASSMTAINVIDFANKQNTDEKYRSIL